MLELETLAAWIRHQERVSEAWVNSMWVGLLLAGPCHAGQVHIPFIHTGNEGLDVVQKLLVRAHGQVREQLPSEAPLLLEE